ncbi:PglZ domain-containing protein [Thiohalocapsa sp. ML1]|uniref:PglZ domain-containing protein n=1 Tax=Thiohalocapsa sp. ML1 TaxID=1431688 RepID=UPI00073233CB|nr:PglZ domain-containing protein [Thiohalocapsa sp. ML1]
MSIANFVQQEVLRPRLERHHVLVVYDPARRWREVCLGLASDAVQVVDAGAGSILAREAAMACCVRLGRPGNPVQGLLVYVPAARPATDEARQRDPFSIYEAAGAVFPDGDGDSYLDLCLKAKPDHKTALRRVFADDPEPGFAIVDAVGGGVGWPRLRGLLEVESSRDVLMALLAPNDAQEAALKQDDTWVAEAKELFLSALGLKLKTRAKHWSTIAAELWRFLLFSEFVLDLPGASAAAEADPHGLPAALAEVPRAPAAARPLVEDLCARLRGNERTRQLYMDRAEVVEGPEGLNLRALCADMPDPGVRDTFEFEERTFLRQAVAALAADEPDRVRAIVQRQAGSVWAGRGEQQAHWGLVAAALQLTETCDDCERELPAHTRSMAALIDFYVTRLREVDRCQRELEQAAGDVLDLDGSMDALIEQARRRYRKLAEQLQSVFTKHLETEGWPPAGRLANADVFDRCVAPALGQSGRRVALFLVDALRYELGVALQRQLAEDEPVELLAAAAQLPTITSVGMASLLPGAGSRLRLARVDNAPVPMLGDTPVGNLAQRLDVLRKRFGDRFEAVKLTEFARGKAKLPAHIDLLVLRSVEIDHHLESDAENTLKLIHDTLKRIRVALHRLRQAGFHEAVIAADHGFFLNAQAGPGDVCAKPPGDWVSVHERCLLGAGRGDASHVLLSADKAGIRGDFPQLAVPRSLAPYRAGLLYFHGGASLQEALVPVLTLKLTPVAPPPAQAAVKLRYRRGAKRITTRLPVVEVLVEAKDLFAAVADFEILLEAHDGQGNVVGEAKAGGPVNPATGTLVLQPGQSQQVTIRMQLEFEGGFRLKALNPTTLETYDELALETDYSV